MGQDAWAATDALQPHSTFAADYADGRSAGDASRAVSFVQGLATEYEEVEQLVRAQAVRALTLQGLSVRDIASRLNMSKSTVARVARTPPVFLPAESRRRLAHAAITTAWDPVEEPGHATAPPIPLSPDHFILLASMAAEDLARTTADSIYRGSRFFHPGDPLGTVLALAWRSDPGHASLVMTAYVRQLREACDAHEIEAPSLTKVLTSVTMFTLNPDRFPDVDVAAMERALARDVPKMLGA